MPGRGTPPTPSRRWLKWVLIAIAILIGLTVFYYIGWLAAIVAPLFLWRNWFGARNRVTDRVGFLSGWNPVALAAGSFITLFFVWGLVWASVRPKEQTQVGKAGLTPTVSVVSAQLVSQRLTVTPAPMVATATPVPPTSTAVLPTATQVALVSVVEVVDGDTIKVDLGGKVETIRVIGIDTPETMDPRKPVQCFGQEASTQAHKLLDGQQVRLVADRTVGDRDKYQRLLRYAELTDGTDYGLWMLQNGYAHEYTYDTPYERQAAYKQAEASARDGGVGLWAVSACNGDTEQAAEAPRATNGPAQVPEIATPVPVAATEAPAVPTPTEAAAPAGGCDPAYPDVCIKSPPPDLNCDDIPYRQFRVLPPDPHEFDRDKNGIGCESD